MITIETKRPNALLQAIKDVIDANQVKTWRYETDGTFTHSPSQWDQKAWLDPTVDKGVSLSFGVLAPAGAAQLDRLYFSVYQGRFTEMLVGNFPTDFTQVSVTSEPVLGVDSFVKD